MDDLLKAAFVGTRNHAPPDADAHPVDALVPELLGDAERRVLLRAGARAVWRTAGYRPPRNITVPEACPPDASPKLSDRAAQLLRHSFGSNIRGLLADLLQQTHAAGIRLPARAAPEALSLGRTLEVRQPLQGVIGERGKWLARLNPDWFWAATDQDIANRDALRGRWEEGTLGERVEALRSLLAVDAAEARTWLESSFTGEKADSSQPLPRNACDSPFARRRALSRTLPVGSKRSGSYRRRRFAGAAPTISVRGSHDDAGR